MSSFFCFFSYFYIITIDSFWIISETVLFIGINFIISLISKSSMCFMKTICFYIIFSLPSCDIHLGLTVSTIVSFLITKMSRVFLLLFFRGIQSQYFVTLAFREFFYLVTIIRYISSWNRPWFVLFFNCVILIFLEVTTAFGDICNFSVLFPLSIFFLWR